jgi:hypothetical protein
LHPRIFAIGDITDWKEQKQVGKYYTHASIVANNILATLDKRTTLKSYKGSFEMIVVTIGKVRNTPYLVQYVLLNVFFVVWWIWLLWLLMGYHARRLALFNAEVQVVDGWDDEKANGALGLATCMYHDYFPQIAILCPRTVHPSIDAPSNNSQYKRDGRAKSSC